jgi:glycosyltransferase involved in cell wall biosynthesis
MKISWAANSYDGVGNAFGYTTHQKNLRAALEEIGVEITDDAEILVHIVVPDVFKPDSHRKNILYTMYEMATIPERWVSAVNAADLIVTPCTHNQKLFSRYTDKPVEMCWEGVKVADYTYRKREFPKDEPFIFLWVGASNPRKGYEHVVAAWTQFKRMHPELNGKVRLIMKTTQTGEGKHFTAFEYDPEQTMWVGKKGSEVEMPKERIINLGKGNQIDSTIDTRRLPLHAEGDLPGLVDLYHMAHAFLLPSMGEGFGLTLAEAMSTGLPCIYTPWSGPRDFADATTGYPVKWRFTKVASVVRRVFVDGREESIPQHSSLAASAEIGDIVRKMEQIYFNYDEALRRGVKAAERIRKDFTWYRSAASFKKIVEKYEKLWMSE